MDAGRRLLVERAFFDLKAARKELIALLSPKDADEYLLLLVRKGGLGAKQFEERVLKDGV